MITIEVGEVLGIGIEPHISEVEIQEVLRLISPTKIAFVDLASTAKILGLITALEKMNHKMVSYYDHHADPQRMEAGNISLLCQKFKDVQVVGREKAPCCCQLVTAGSLNGISVIFFHADFDGLLSLLRGMGIIYPEMLSDAAIMDGGKRGKLSGKGQLLADSQDIGPYFSVNPDGYRNTLQRVFQTFANWAVANFQPSEEINLFRSEVAEATRAACDIATTLAQETKLFKLKVAFCDFREAIKTGRIIAFPVWKEQVFTRFGNAILLCNVGLGHMGEQVFIEIPRAWEARGVNLQDFLPHGIEARLKNKVQVPFARWQEFLKNWQEGFPKLKNKLGL